MACRRLALAGLALALLGCKSKPARRDDDGKAPPVVSVPTPADAAAPAVDAGAWPELARLPGVEPVRVIAIPARPDVPRFTLGGPVLIGDLALVSSSQFGFAAVDFRRGQLVWMRPAGSHVAPPLAVDGNAVLIGDCLSPPTIPDGEQLLGCVRVVTPAGADQAYVAIRSRQADAFLGSAGEQRVWRDGDRVVWKRGEAAVSIDLLSGLATPVAADEPPLVITHKGKTWQVRRTEDGYIEASGARPWRTDNSHGPLLGAVYIPEQAPMVRVASPTIHEGAPEILIRDMDATGSLHGQVSLYPVPGIGLVGHAIDRVGNVALAIRLDKSLQRDFIAGYATSALLMWTYPLPPMPRPDPVGIAMAHDAVVVFHDGDTVTVLPEVSAPPTAPGAVRAPSENSTP